MNLLSKIDYRLIIIFLLLSTILNYAQQKNSAILNYKIMVKDKNILPVINASIKVTTFGINGGEDIFLKTNSNGYATGSFNIGKSNITSVIIFEGKIMYSIEKEGFCHLDKIEHIIKDINEIKDTCIITAYLKIPTALSQKFVIKVIDRKMKPVEGAMINLQSSLNYSYKTESTLQTDIQGMAFKVFNYSDSTYLCNDELRVDAKTSITYSIVKDGYYKKSSITNIYMYKDNLETAVLTQPSDYFDDQFLSTKKYKKLVIQTFNYLNSILLESYLRDCVLDYNSILVENFKKKNYLQMRFTDVNTYNSIKLSNYDIAKRIFDEVVRKLLNPLNDNLNNSKEVDGYCVIIQSKSKNFVDENSVSKYLVYMFYLPKAEVVNYKNNDITGQQLVDRSIILLNNERIDLKLQ